MQIEQAKPRRSPLLKDQFVPVEHKTESPVKASTAPARDFAAIAFLKITAYKSGTKITFNPVKKAVFDAEVYKSANVCRAKPPKSITPKTLPLKMVPQFMGRFKNGHRSRRINEAAINLWARKTNTSTWLTASLTITKVTPQKNVVKIRRI